MRVKRHTDHLGHLVPFGALGPAGIRAALVAAMDARRYMAGLGVPSVPTRYVVSMNPADRAWLDPGTEDELARTLERHAERSGTLIIGRIGVEFRADRRLPLGKPDVWVGFAEGDLLVLASPRAAADIFTGAATTV